MNGQTESANRVMKNYLHMYIAYAQDNWVDHLPIAEFAANNYVNASTDMTLFFADHGFHSCTSIKLPGMYKSEWQAELLAADKIICRQKEMMTFLQDQLAWSQDEQTRFANRTRQPYLEYQISDKVYVDARHFASEKDKKLLDLKNARPWEIIWNINNKAYELEIPQTLKYVGLTTIFHPWKLHLALNSLFSGQILPSNIPIKVSAENDDNEAHKE